MSIESNDGDFDEFMDSIWKGDIDEVKTLFRSEYINMKDENGIRPLHWACEWDSGGDVVQYLIKEGFDINIVGNLGQTPIHIAAWMGHVNVMRKLLSQKCILDSRDDGGRTPLDLAIEERRDSCADILIEAMRQVEATVEYSNKINKKAEIPVSKLFKKNSLSIIVDIKTRKTLLDIVIERKDHKTMHAIKKKPVNDQEVKDWLDLKLRRVNPESFRLLQECLLSRSVKQRNDSAFITFCTPDIINRQTLFMGPTILERASRLGKTWTVKNVLMKLMYEDESWERSLEFATHKRHRTTVKVIEDRKKHLAMKYKNGCTRLHVAVSDNQPDMIDYILENKLVNPNIEAKDIGTALHLAYYIGYNECIFVLQSYKSVVPTKEDLELMTRRPIPSMFDVKDDY